MTLRRRRLLVSLLGAGLVAPARAAAQPRPWPRDRATPTLALPGHDGPAFDLADARGQVLLLNFWASWCPPCVDELPSLDVLAERHAADGLRVVAVNHRETDRALGTFMQFMPLNRTRIVRDADGAASQAWGVRVFPTTVVVGRGGRAAFSVVGEADWAGADAARWLAPLLPAR